MATTDPKRLNKILVAVTAGAKKDEFVFESEDERTAWDQLAIQVAQIVANGQIVSIPNE